nr:hypothetical protein CFP56_57065 [Quercus suber]
MDLSELSMRSGLQNRRSCREVQELSKPSVRQIPFPITDFMPHASLQDSTGLYLNHRGESIIYSVAAAIIEPDQKIRDDCQASLGVQIWYSSFVHRKIAYNVTTNSVSHFLGSDV